MAYYSKEAYEGKARWATEHRKKNEQIAIDNGATKEQAEAISKLCDDRHYIHCYCERVFISESEPADIICKMLAEEASYAGININEYLKKVGLEPIKYTYSFVDDTENDSTYEYSEMSREEAEEKTMEVMHQFNEDILDYLRNFDKKYDTKFTPIGYREELM